MTSDSKLVITWVGEMVESVTSHVWAGRWPEHDWPPLGPPTSGETRVGTRVRNEPSRGGRWPEHDWPPPGPPTSGALSYQRQGWGLEFAMNLREVFTIMEYAFFRALSHLIHYALLNGRYPKVSKIGSLHWHKDHQLQVTFKHYANQPVHPLKPWPGPARWL